MIYKIEVRVAYWAAPHLQILSLASIAHACHPGLSFSVISVAYFIGSCGERPCRHQAWWETTGDGIVALPGRIWDNPPSENTFRDKDALDKIFRKMPHKHFWVPLARTFGSVKTIIVPIPQWIGCHLWNFGSHCKLSTYRRLNWLVAQN
jgi:hypothetical protein